MGARCGVLAAHNVLCSVLETLAKELCRGRACGAGVTWQEVLAYATAVADNIPEPSTDNSSQESRPPRVAVTTLGCTRNDVDSSELAGRLAAGGWELVTDPQQADVAVVNTCGFIEQAKKDSVDVVLDLADGDDGPAVVAIGCLAQRYGQELAQELPEAAAVLGFDSYANMSDHLKAVLAGNPPASHTPQDRRTLLPLSPVKRAGRAVTGTSAGAQGGHERPEHKEAAHQEAGAGGEVELPTVYRDIDGSPWQPLKLASGCDRRCSFCAIPQFRGAFVSRLPQHVVHEARWLAERGVSEVFLVSENTTSYGKDLGDIRSLEALLPQLAQVPGLERIRLSYLQPAEIRPGLIEAIVSTEKVVPYFDVSFQHAATPVLRRMRRFGSPEAFLGLVEQIRRLAPQAGIRTNMIVGFPGETEEDFNQLLDFVGDAQLDVCGVFEYSDEDGTEAVGLPDHVPSDVITERAEALRRVAEAVTDDRAQLRVGEQVRVLVEDNGPEGVWGRADHQGPDVDGQCELVAAGAGGDFGRGPWQVGDYLTGEVVEAVGADLTVRVL